MSSNRVCRSRGGESAQHDQLRAIGRLDTSFGNAGLDNWLFGGWAVDFHAGRITRDHEDIDLAVWHADAAAVHSLFIANGWELVTAVPQDGYATYAHEGLEVDVAFLARDGNEVYTPLDSGRGEWPIGSFGDDARTIGAARARVVTLSSLLQDKSERHGDRTTEMKDAADLAVLRFVAQGPPGLRSARRRR